MASLQKNLASQNSFTGAQFVKIQCRRGYLRSRLRVQASKNQRQPKVHGIKNSLYGVDTDSETSPTKSFDFLVLGSGIAGLSYALKVAEYGTVAIITKDTATEGCTQYAQGGVSAVMDGLDSVAAHVHDTIVAGAYLNNSRAVEVVCKEGPQRVMELVEIGTNFTRATDGSLHLTKEGGHSHRRIVHAADTTGREIERALLQAAHDSANITFFENHLAVDLVVDDVKGVKHCFGVDVLNVITQQQFRFVGLSTMLATGGAGQIYPNTTNPHVATGDGIAMAFRARARVANMEFVQFHPTGLYTNSSSQRRFLITEAVRGEGGVLLNTNGERFMKSYDSRLELAPRDVVARSIHQEMIKTNSNHVLLDISHQPADRVLSHFPNIASVCSGLGIDITRDPIPVVPTQHYMCGGVFTGLLGNTDIQGLFAAGEVAYTGLHGANRLASNSLLEGLVFAQRAVEASAAHANYSASHCTHALANAIQQGPKQLGVCEPDAELNAWVAEQQAGVQELMWRACGIVRGQQTMQQAYQELVEKYVDIYSKYKRYRATESLVQLYNQVTVAELVLCSAMNRKESRGLHYCTDYPEQRQRRRHPTVIKGPINERVNLDVSNISLRQSDISSLAGTRVEPGERSDLVADLIGAMVDDNDY